jgi:phage terminase small subunit
LSLSRHMVDLTPKQEAFAQAYVEGGNAAAAYRQCYDVSPSAKPETVWSEASLLLGNPKVTARVLAIRAELRVKNAVSIDTIQALAMAAYEKAMDEGKGASAAVSAATLIAKLHGLITDRQEQKVTAMITATVVDRPPGESRDEWLARRKREMGAMEPTTSH